MKSSPNDRTDAMWLEANDKKVAQARENLGVDRDDLAVDIALEIAADLENPGEIAQRAEYQPPETEP